MKRIVILISGRGSNMERSCGPAPPRAGRRESRRWSATGPTPPGWRSRASTASPTAVVDHKAFADARCLRRRAGAQRSTRYAPDLVVLAGFMRILGAGVRAPLRRAHAQHPSVAAAGVPGPAHAPARDRGRLQGGRRDGALRDAEPRPRADRRSRRSCRCCPATTRRRWPRACWRSEHVIYPRAVRWFVEGVLRVEHGVVTHAAASRSSLQLSAMHPNALLDCAAELCCAQVLKFDAPGRRRGVGVLPPARDARPARAPHAGRDGLRRAAPAAAVPAPGAERQRARCERRLAILGWQGDDDVPARPRSGRTSSSGSRSVQGDRPSRRCRTSCATTCPTGWPQPLQRAARRGEFWPLVDSLERAGAAGPARQHAEGQARGRAGGAGRGRHRGRSRRRTRRGACACKASRR